MITKEEFEKVVEICTNADRNCGQCPLSKKIYRCGGYLARYIKENEPALSANSTSSEVSVKEDTDNIHLDDSTLLDICQEAFVEVVERSGGNYSSGYAQAIFDVIRKVRGGDGK